MATTSISTLTNLMILMRIAKSYFHWYVFTEISGEHQQPIAGLTVSTTQSIFSVSIEVTFELSVSEGSNVTFSIDFGDGNSANIIHLKALLTCHMQVHRGGPAASRTQLLSVHYPRVLAVYC